jgi:LysR family nitrogen assimilation transcriptional regulator
MRLMHFSYRFYARRRNAAGEKRVSKAPDILDLRKLFYFREILAHRSFRQAAQRLGVTQPALSRVIQELEQSFGTSLLQRDVRGNKPTEAGRLLSEKAAELLLLASSARKAVEELRSHPVGAVTLALPISFSMTFLPTLVDTFRQKFPDVRLRIVEGSARHIEEWLGSGEADVGVIVAPSASGGLIEEVILEEELLLFGPPGQEQRSSWQAADLATLPLIMPLPPHGTRKIVDRLIGPKLGRLAPVLEIDSPHTIRELVLRSGYFTIASPLIFSQDMAEGRVSSGRIDSSLVRRLAIATRKGDPLSSAARALTLELRKLVQAYLRTKGAGQAARTPLTLSAIPAAGAAASAAGAP